MAATFTFEPSGKLKLPSHEQLAADDADSSILSYTTGVMEDGRPYYAFIAVKPSKYAEFHRMTKEGWPLILTDYGEIVAGDFLPEAPSAVVREMEKKHGFDFEFEEKLKQEVIKQRGEFSQQREENRILDIVARMKKKGKK